MDGYCHWEKEYGCFPDVCGVGLCLSHYGYFLVDSWIDGVNISLVDQSLIGRGYEGQSYGMRDECTSMERR